ncbi:kinase-like domain-containing protein, partial [Gilbertella persicaria]|uniref:kinase-like domain-containing protein n=1 Tax=Gilbertella persicaria TaxID=101096 RepID=UPI00221E6319
MNTIYDINVKECPILVKDTLDKSWKTVPEFSITVKTDEYTFYIVRYIPDLYSFDHLVKTHYPKIKIHFPNLSESLSKAEKRRSIKTFFHLPVKSNAEKVEKYLIRCSVDPILKTSSLLRDFFSPQRENDQAEHHSSAAYPSPTTDDTAPSTVDSMHIGKTWAPSPHPSIISLLKQISFEKDPLDNLEMLKVLGKGCMGKVKHVIEQREITHTLDERNILAKLSDINHPYLTKLHLSFQDEHRLYLLTNYYCGGDLATHMAKLYNFTRECALFYAAEIIEGIGELHRLGILYRDLKPENILLTGDGHIILTDFGLSKWLQETDDLSTQTFCGTAEYLAPEILLGESYSFGIDHWSFGTILYEMLAGVTPFWADNHADMYKRVLEDPLEFPADIFDYETAEFLSDILDRDPRTRLGANGIDEIKNHVYFADICWDSIRHRQVQPPYLPPVKDEMDLTNFDQEFLTMSPALTPVSSEIEFADQIQDVFDGYSFTDEHY